MRRTWRSPNYHPCTYSTSTLLPPQPLHAYPKKKDKEITFPCTNMPYTAFNQLTQMPVTAELWEQSLQWRLQGKTQPLSLAVMLVPISKLTALRFPVSELSRLDSFSVSPPRGPEVRLHLLQMQCKRVPEYIKGSNPNCALEFTCCCLAHGNATRSSGTCDLNTNACGKHIQPCTNFTNNTLLLIFQEERRISH